MGWSIGYDETWKRDIGYGVPATCDHPGCTEEIDRGLGYVCGGEPHGGERGCGLFVCSKHQHANKHCGQLCQHCADRRRKKLTPSPDTPEWIEWKLTDESWQQWREKNPEEVASMITAQSKNKPIPPETPAEFALRLLVAAGHVTQEKADHALAVASKFTAHTKQPTSEKERELALVEAALQAAFEKCDQKYIVRVASGHPREASTARSLADEIRVIDRAAIIASVP